jgi:hypothetical protein
VVAYQGSIKRRRGTCTQIWCSAHASGQGAIQRENPQRKPYPCFSIDGSAGRASCLIRMREHQTCFRANFASLPTHASFMDGWLCLLPRSDVAATVGEAFRPPSRCTPRLPRRSAPPLFMHARTYVNSRPGRAGANLFSP